MSSFVFKLRFPEATIAYWSDKYNYGGAKQRDRETTLEITIGPDSKARGYFTLAELKTICQWKSPRRWALCQKNPPIYVEDITRMSLAPTASEQLRIEVLTLLTGVDWPTASVILHFASDPYPILDFRALWSLSIHPPPAPYRFDFWDKYTAYCRNLAARNKVSMRVLDRALWQYSKENQ